MGIIVKHLESNEIVFYLKGADQVLRTRIPEAESGYVMDECESLAEQGLRTLVLS
jgi:phospholipid-translocating ATPase